MQVSRLTPNALTICTLVAVLTGCNSAGSQQLAPAGPAQQTNLGIRSRPDTFPGRNGRIAFLQGLSFGGDVYTMNSDGTHVRRLTHIGPSFTDAVVWENWSSDGRRLVLQVSTAANNYNDAEVWLMNANGKNLHQLFSDPGFIDGTPSFAPDGEHVLYNRCSDTVEVCAIYRINVDGNDNTPVTHFAENRGDDKAVYSPDGSQIALNAGRLGGYAFPLALMNADGRDIKLVTPTRLGGDAVSWSPDGRRLAFDTYFHFVFGSNEEIWSSDTRGGDLKRLTKNNFPGQRSYYAQPHDLNASWSPRGDAIVFERWNGAFTSWGIYILKLSPHGDVLTTKRLLGGNSLGIARSPVRGNSHERSLSAVTPRQIESGGVVPRWGSAPDTDGSDGNS
ncbi:MAG: hypothetical protein WB810_17000 [Candidatus Cybelea sp.]